MLINLQKNVATLYEELFVVWALLKCDIRVIQCLFIFLCSEVGLSDAVVDSDVP